MLISKSEMEDSGSDTKTADLDRTSQIYILMHFDFKNFMFEKL